MKSLFLAWSLVFSCSAWAGEAWQSALSREVETRISNGQFVDGAAGVITKGQREIETFGNAKSDTIFEIGSITKTFTAIIFARLINEGVLGESDPVEKFVPDLKGTFAGQIKLSELASHTSGLVKIPSDIPLDSNPYVDYTWPKFLNYLRSLKTARTEKPFALEYSNSGYALLGHVLSVASGKSYFALVRSEITRPLKMRDTFGVVSPSKRSRFIDGYDNLKVAHHWEFDVFAPTGAMRSTILDMSKFAQALLKPDSSWLGRAIALIKTRAWGSDERVLDLPFFYKNGGTGGFRSVLLIDNRREIAIFILTNVSYDADALVVPIIRAIINRKYLNSGAEVAK